jgi:hypothetical protein
MQSSSYQLNKFLEYVRALQFCQNALKVDRKDSFVFVSMNDIQRRFLNNPSEDIEKLIADGELEVKQITTKKGHKCYLYKTLRPGYYDLTLLKPKGKELDKTTSKMMLVLKDVSLKQGSESTFYFDEFLKHKNELTRLFFNVDRFSGRVHTPITSFKGEFRKNILIENMETISIDVVTMQPILLGKILEIEIGENEYSNWINEGKDIYLVFQEVLGINDRSIAKERFFEILFAPANMKLNSIFGDANWINWINAYKSKPVFKNPHSVEKNHSNLAWLLQSTEVKIMRQVWENLLAQNIAFLSVHDEIIVKIEDYHIAKSIFSDVLNSNFKFYKLSDKGVADYEVNNILESNSNDINSALMLEKTPTNPPSPKKEIQIFEVAKSGFQKRQEYLLEIAELESFFKNTTIPTSPIQLDRCSTIANPQKFIESHLQIVKCRKETSFTDPYLERLQKLKEMMACKEQL